MNITFFIDYDGTPDVDDNLAQQHIVFLENQRRERANEQINLSNIAAVKENLVRAAQKPPGTPVPILDLLILLKTQNAADVKTSYLEVLTADLTTQHLANIKLAKSITGLMVRYTKEETERIFANVTIPLNRNVAKGDVLEDTDVIALKPAP